MKLIKSTNPEYYLVNSKGIMIASSSITEGLQKLSKENCDEIFGFVDVNELAEENYPSGDDWTIEESLIRKLAFKNGFNKAMELNKDKLFSEEIIEDNFKGLRDCIEDKDIAEFYINLAKTIFCEIEPTEIEIEMDDIYDGIDSARIFTKEETMVPKLDENGCLILTKKK